MTNHEKKKIVTIDENDELRNIFLLQNIDCTVYTFRARITALAQVEFEHEPGLGEEFTKKNPRLNRV